MPRTPDELAMVERFDRQYLRGRSETLRAIERSVCGCDYGGTSWTTRREADHVAALLKLRAGTRLLDVGAGSGWPALYMARSSGCDVTLADVPVEGIRIAAGRAAEELPGGVCTAAVGDGCALPFKSRAFDAVSHSDVLCCLPGKSGLLRESRRVVRERGAMVFTVIAIVPGLAPERRADAVAFGPPYVEAECEYPEMLAKTGWRVKKCLDITAEFTDSVRKFVHQWKRNRADVTAVVGREDFDTALERQTGKLRVLEEGGLCRQLYAVVPASGGRA